MNWCNPMKPKESAQNRYISVREVAERFNVSSGTVWRWTRTGALPQPLRLSAGCTRWRAEDVDAFEARALSAAGIHA